MIRWVGVDSTTPVRIDYSTDGGSEWRQLKAVARGLQFRWRNMQIHDSSRLMFRICELKKDMPHGANPVTMGANVSDSTKYLANNALLTYSSGNSLMGIGEYSLFDIDSRSMLPTMKCYENDNIFQPAVSYPLCNLRTSPDGQYLSSSCAITSQGSSSTSVRSLVHYGYTGGISNSTLCTYSDDLSWSGDSRFVRSGNQVRDMRGTVTNMTPAQVDSIRWVGYGGIGSLPRQPFYVDGSDTLRSIYDNPNMPVRWISPSEYRTCNYTSIYSRRSSNSLIGNVTKIATPSSFTIYGAPHYSSTGDTLYGCGWDGSAYMVNHTGNVLRSFRIPSKKISHINSSHNFIFVSCGDSVCYLFSKRDTTRQDIVLFPGRETEAPNQLFIVSAFSVNNRYVAVNTASNNHSSTMTVYDTRVNQPCYMVQYNDDAIHSRMLFNKTSSYIAFRATRTSIRVVSLQDTSVSWLLSHSGQVLGYHWHPTGKAILTGSLDSTLVIWNPDNGSIIKAIRTPHPVYVVHWNHNGSQILYSTNDSTFILDLQSGLIIDRTHGVMNIASDNVLSPNEDRVVLLDGVTYLTWYIYFTSERRTVWHLGSPYVSGSADSTTIPLSVADSIVSVFDDVERNTHHQSITYSNNMLYLNDNTDAVSSVSIYSLHGALIRRISGDELAPHIPLDFLPSGMYALCAEGKGKATSIPLAIIR